MAVTASTVAVTAGRLIDVTLDLDAGAGTDNGSAEPGAECGPAQVVFDIINTSGSITVGAGDTIGVALWNTFPSPGLPTTFGEIQPITEFPARVTVEVAPDMYWAVICFQKADSTSMTCTGPGDVRLLFNGLAPFAVGQGETVMNVADMP